MPEAVWLSAVGRRSAVTALGVSRIGSLSGGRAEIMAGRGALIEPFHLCGFDLADYDSLFSEKLELLLAPTRHDKGTWSGWHRTPLQDEVIYPRPIQRPWPVWLAGGGGTGSIMRAGRLGLPLALGIVGGRPALFEPLIDLKSAFTLTYGKGRIR